jgi:hypothetical protein
MKKIIGFIGVVILAITVFVFSSTSNGTNEIDLASLTSINQAEAEGPCIGNNFIIISIPGGWRCVSGGYSCCPLL